MSHSHHSIERRAPDSADTRGGLERKATRGPAVALGGVTLLTGAYAAVSPWVVHFSATNPNLTANDLIIGLGIALIGFALPFTPGRSHHLVWTLAPIGLWLVLAPSIVTASHGVSAGIVWSNSWAGGIGYLVGLIASTHELAGT